MPDPNESERDASRRDKQRLRWVSYHWPTFDEWDTVENKLNAGLQAVEEMMFRLKVTREEDAAPTPTFEELGVHQAFVHYLENDLHQLSDLVDSIRLEFGELDEIRMNADRVEPIPA